MTFKISSNGKIDSIVNLGQMVRTKRKADGLTQADAAALCNVGVRFLGEVENGKPTAEIGKVLDVLHGLGLELYLAHRGSE